MPTALDRIQTLLRPEDHAKVKTLAKANRRTLSAMAAELICMALKLEEVQKQLEAAPYKFKPKPDPRGTQPIEQYKVTPTPAPQSNKEDKLVELLELMRTYLKDDD